MYEAESSIESCVKPFDQSVIHVCSLVDARAGGGNRGPGETERAGLLERANTGVDEAGCDGASGGSLNAWGALVGGLNADTLARAVLLHGVVLTGGVAGTVVVVVVLVDVVHVVVMDVGTLEGLVSLKVTLTAPQDTGLSLGVDSDGLTSAAGSECVGAWGVRVGDEGGAGLNEGVAAVGSWDLSKVALAWQEALALNDANIGVVGSGGDHLTNSELGRGTRVVHLSARAIATLVRVTIARCPLLLTSDGTDGTDLSESLHKVGLLVGHAWLERGVDRSESLQKVILLLDHAWLEHAVLCLLFESAGELLVGGSSETLLDHLGLVHALHVVELVPSGGGTEAVNTGGTGGGGDNESFSLGHAEKLGGAGHGDGAGLSISGAQVNDVALLDVDGLAESSSGSESESRFHSKSSFFVKMIY